MDKMKMIRERHSVRAFLAKPVETELIDQVKAEIDRVNQETGLHIQYIADGKRASDAIALKAIGWKNCQFAIALVGPDNSDLDELCGYWGEHLVLFCQDLGLNSCWAGMAKEKRVNAQVLEGEKYVIAIGFGYGATQGKPHKSKPYKALYNAPGRTEEELPDWFKAGMFAATLAPTSMNQQKFKLQLNPDDTVTPIAEMSIAYSYVDLGIVKYHFEAGSHKDSSIWAAHFDLAAAGVPLRDRMSSNVWY